MSRDAPRRAPAGKGASDKRHPRRRRSTVRSVAELRKVVWPTQQQVVTYFFVVLVFVLVMMAIVAGARLRLLQGRVPDLRLTVRSARPNSKVAKTSVSQSYDEVDPDLPRGQSNAPRVLPTSSRTSRSTRSPRGSTRPMTSPRPSCPTRTWPSRSSRTPIRTPPPPTMPPRGQTSTTSQDLTPSSPPMRQPPPTSSTARRDAAVEDAATGEDAQIALAAAAADDDAQPDVLQEFRDRLREPVR
ncbi:MAG: preprotein translocase subunit SecE [Nocardioidaceae bacterium]